LVPAQRVSLKVRLTLRLTFELFATLLEDAQNSPSHNTEIVGPDLPYYYGNTNASGIGA